MRPSGLSIRILLPLYHQYLDEEAVADVAYLHSIRVGLSDELLHLQDGPAMQGELPLLLRRHNTHWLSADSPDPTAQSAGGQDLDALVTAGYHQSQPTNVSNVPLAKPQERETKIEIKRTVEVRILSPSDPPFAFTDVMTSR